MLCHTLKATLLQLKKFAGPKEFVLSLVEEGNENYKVEFTVNSVSVTAKYNVNDLEWISEVNMIDDIVLPEKLRILMIKESNDMKEEKTIPVTFEAQLFVEVFRVMKDRAQFNISYEGKEAIGYYINRKMFIVEETDTEYKVIESNLYKFYRGHGHYSITLFTPLLGKIDQTIYLEQQKEIAAKLDKNFSVQRE